jgi:signal transduction histidine kinase
MDEPRILIVDDEEKNIKLLKGILLSQNYKFYEALNGQNALELVHDISPHLILLDVMMPGISGFEVCQKLKQDEKTKSIPIIMVTALSEKEHRLKAMESGADDFLSKPVESTEVVVRVKSLLRIKSYHDEIANNYKEISEKNEKLLELEKLKVSLIHMIVHDLRNPLGVVFGNLDLMSLDKAKFTQNHAKQIETCIDYCQEIMEMVDSLLDIYKMEEGQMKLNLEKADLEDLIDESIKPFLIKIEEKPVAFSYDCADRNLSVQVDRRIVKRVLANLINNAIRHTPPGGEIEIVAEPYQNNGNFHLKVKDTGNGIEPAFHQKVFDKFEQIKLQKSGISVGASGLGLSFCKLAVEAHGGKIWVESEGEGKGACFQLAIPISPALKPIHPQSPI